MANYKELVPFVLCYEGGFVNSPTDRGGATNKGVTIATWRAFCAKKGKPATIKTLKAMTQSEWEEIFKTMYWDKCKADCINDQAIASALVDFAWHSGVTTAVKKIQQIVKAPIDGIVGPLTLKAINEYRPPRGLFGLLQASRFSYIMDVVTAHPEQKKYFKGWLRRIDALSYDKLS